MKNNTKDRLINEIAFKLQNGGFETYREFMKYLADSKQFFLRCYLLDNRYLFGSFVKEAEDRISK